MEVTYFYIRLLKFVGVIQKLMPGDQAIFDQHHKD